MVRFEKPATVSNGEFGPLGEDRSNSVPLVPEPVMVACCPLLESTSSLQYATHGPIKRELTMLKGYRLGNDTAEERCFYLW
jgi:hypothetical protein